MNQKRRTVGRRKRTSTAALTRFHVHSPPFYFICRPNFFFRNRSLCDATSVFDFGFRKKGPTDLNQSFYSIDAIIIIYNRHAHFYGVMCCTQRCVCCVHLPIRICHIAEMKGKSFVCRSLRWTIVCVDRTDQTVKPKSAYIRLRMHFGC